MIGKAITTVPTTQGVTASQVAAYQRLFDTSIRPGRVLWEGGEAVPPGTVPTPPADPPPAPAADAATTARLSAALEGLMNQRRHGGDVNAVAMTLLRENHDYRDQLRALQGRVPAEGSVVLTPEQAQAWQAYRQLSPDPAALRTRLEQGSQAVEREQVRELARVSQASAAVLADRLRTGNVLAEVVDLPAANGQPARQEVHVFQLAGDGTRGADQGELRAYAQANWADFMPALYPQGGQAQGVPVAAQAGNTAGTSGAANPIAAALEHRRPAAEGQATPVVDALSFSQGAQR